MTRLDLMADQHNSITADTSEGNPIELTSYGRTAVRMAWRCAISSPAYIVNKLKCEPGQVGVALNARKQWLRDDKDGMHG